MDFLGYILFGVAAVAAVVFYFLRQQDASRANELAGRAEKAEKELATFKQDGGMRKETLEARTKELAEVKEKLRDAKKRLHDEKETHRKSDIEHAVAQTEREAQAQIEAARREAAEAQLEIKRLQAELETKGAKRPKTESKPVETKTEVKVDLAAPETPAAPVEPQKPRELTKVEQDRISLLERQAVKQAERVKQLEEDLKRMQRRAEGNDKVYRVAKSEAEQARSRMGGVEKRLNATLLELDKLRQRAFKAGLTNEIVAAQAEAESETAKAVATSPADVPLSPEAKA